MKHESLRTNAGACRRSLAVAASICLLHAGAGLSAPAFKGPDLAELPEPAQKAIKEQAGDGKLVRIEETIKDDQPCYRVELKKDGKDRSFTVDDEGKLCRLQVFLEETPFSRTAPKRSPFCAADNPRGLQKRKLSLTGRTRQPQPQKRKNMLLSPTRRMGQIPRVLLSQGMKSSPSLRPKKGFWI